VISGSSRGGVPRTGRRRVAWPLLRVRRGAGRIEQRVCGRLSMFPVCEVRLPTRGAAERRAAPQ